MNYLGKRTVQNSKFLHHKMCMWNAIFIATCPIDCYTSEGLRSKETQQEYFKKGVTKCDGVIKVSKHQDNPTTPEIDSRAVDIYYVGWKPSDSPDDPRWGVLYEHALYVDKITGFKLVHGYDWGWDKPHHELAREEV